MKIVHVSNFSLKRNATEYWGIPYKLTSALTRLGHHVFNFSDRATADSFFLGMRKLGAGYANRKLLGVCKEVRPDLVLLGHCGLIRPTTLDDIRRAVPGVRLAHWNCDPLFDTRNLARLRDLAPMVDASFVTTAGRELEAVVTKGGCVAHMPNPADANIESLRAFACNAPQNDLVFMTTPHPEKQRLADMIASQIPDLKFALYGLNGHPAVRGSALFDALGAAKMGLNASRRNDVFLYSSDRMTLLMGNGLLTLMDRKTGFDTIFGEDELAFYDGDSDLIAKIAEYRTDDTRRRSVARKGRRRIHELFDSRLVSQWILDLAFGCSPSRPYGWPTEVFGR
jgi:hypothetical protein